MILARNLINVDVDVDLASFTRSANETERDFNEFAEQ